MDVRMINKAAGPDNIPGQVPKHQCFTHRDQFVAVLHAFKINQVPPPTPVHLKHPSEGFPPSLSSSLTHTLTQHTRIAHMQCRQLFVLHIVHAAYETAIGNCQQYV